MLDVMRVVAARRASPSLLQVDGLAVSSEDDGPASTAHEGGGIVLHQLSLAGGHSHSDLGHVTADAIQQLLAEGIHQKPTMLRP